MIAGLKLIMLALWWGAATSKLNRHFPFVVRRDDQQQPAAAASSGSSAGSTAPSRRPAARPARRLAAAHGGTVVEYAVPLVLVLSPGGDRHHRRAGRDGRVPPAHHVDLPDGRAAGVERLLHLLGARPLRPLRRRSVPSATALPAAGRRCWCCAWSWSRCSATCARDLVSFLPSMRLLRRQLGHQPVVFPQGRRGAAQRAHRQGAPACPSTSSPACTAPTPPSWCCTRGWPGGPCTATAAR